MHQARSVLPWRAGLAVLLLGLLAGLPAGAQLRLPRPTGYVNDFANVIPAEQEAQITRIVDEVRAKSGGEIVVVTLPSLQGRPASEVALQIGREWRIGRAGEPGDAARNTGAVVLVSMEDRKWRIETGLGTNTFITAGEAGRIGREYMVPRLGQGDVGGGIHLAVQALAQEYAERFGFQLTGEAPGLRQPARGPSSGGGGGGRLLFYVIAILIIFSLFGRGGG
ncbi:MAG TPA: TPM domain-containing protein, partial [Longimicrobiaceae bacterium]|nr:TPM domain-containing protein [Longimicrobiaceae bacterium]